MRLFLAVSPASEWRRHLSARVDALRDELARRAVLALG